MGFWDMLNEVSREREAMEFNAKFRWLVVAVRIGDGGITQEIVERFQTRDEAQGWWERNRPLRDYCLDYYISPNDDRLKKTLALTGGK